MPANGRWDLIRRLKVNLATEVCGPCLKSPITFRSLEHGIHYRIQADYHVTLASTKYMQSTSSHPRCRWPHDLRRGSTTVRLLELRVVIPTGAWMLCVLRYRSLQRTDPLSRGILPSVCVPLSVIKCNSNFVHLHRVGGRGQTKRILC